MEKSGKQVIIILSSVAVAALALHWGAAKFGAGDMVPVLHATITVLTICLVWFILIRRLAVVVSQAPIEPVSGCADRGVDTVLLQTHTEFSTHFAGAHDDLSQVQALLNDAIVKVLSSFDGMRQLMQVQQEALIFVMSHQIGVGDFSIEHALKEITVAVEEVQQVDCRMVGMDGVSALRLRASLEQIMRLVQQARLKVAQVSAEQSVAPGEIDAAVSGAITALQFQDMVNQLLQHCKLRLGSMQEAWRRMGQLALAEQDNKLAAREETAAARQEIVELFNRIKHIMQRNPVRQEKMNSGDVELF